MILEVLAPFILTFVVELAILIFIGTDPRRTALHAFLINALTWPIATALLMSFPLTSVIALEGVELGLPIGLIVIEVGVILAEGVLISLLFEMSHGKSLVISGLANFLSVFIGLFAYPFSYPLWIVFF